jgi:hypothetical protein
MPRYLNDTTIVDWLLTAQTIKTSPSGNGILNIESGTQTGNAIYFRTNNNTATDIIMDASGVMTFSNLPVCVPQPFLNAQLANKLYVDTRVASVFPTGTNKSDYLYWSGSAWVVGDANITLGGFAGNSGQGANAVAVGYQAGFSNQGQNSISVGFQSGATSQGTNSVAIGYNAGSVYQGSASVAIGITAAYLSQGINSIAIGNNAAYDTQGQNSIAIGYYAAYESQNQYCVAIGYGAGQITQQNYTVSIGYQAGNYLQSDYAVSIGYNAGAQSQQNNAIAIGNQAGFQLQGENSIAIGNSAGFLNQPARSIIINASGSSLNASTTDSCFIKPIRNSTASNLLLYDSLTSEVIYKEASTILQTFSPIIEVLNLSNFGQTVKLNSIPYSDNQQIKTSGIVAKLDSFLDSSVGSQTYTFGPTVQARFVAGGTNANFGSAPTATIYYSTDGNNWIASPTTVFNGAGGVSNSVAYNGTVWVAVGTNASTSPTTTIAYSYDGISWTAALGTTFGSTSGAQARAVAWGGNKFVAVGTSGGTAPTTTSVYSYDGINWQVTATTGSGTGMWSTATYSGSGWGVAYNGTRWVAVGSDGNTTLAVFTNCKCIYYSSDGLTWTNATSGQPFFTQSGTGAIARAVAWNGIKWIAVGTDSTSTVGGQTASRSAFSSTDGITWTVISQNIFGSNQNANLGGWCIAWNGERWVTGGTFRFTSGSMFYSTDGITWTLCTGDTFNINADGFCRGVLWNGYKWIATGVSGSSASLTRTMSYSYDGIQWIGTSVNVFGTNTASSGYEIAYNSVRPNAITFPRNILVGVGSYISVPAVATGSACSISTTGVLTVAGVITGTWQVGQILSGTGVAEFTKITSFLTGTLGGAGTYQTNVSAAVASTAITGTLPGNTTTAYSTDGGLTWNPGTGIFNKAGPSATNSFGWCVAYNGYMWVACGQNDFIGNFPTVNLAYSYDGIVWNAVLNSSFPFSFGVRSICWSPVRKIWIAVGFSYCAAYSYDGISWTSITGFSTFAQFYLLSVSWGKDKFIISGGLDGTNNDIFYSYTGLSGTWVQSTNPLSIPYGIFSTLWNGTMWVGVGAATNNSNGAIYSYDGITWVAGSGATFTSYDFLSSGGQAGIAWNGSLWVITTGTTTCTNPVFYSNNGINWTQSTTTSIFTGTISGTVLTVLSITSGTILIGQVISGSGVTSAVITSFGTGTGGTGTYIISVSQSVSTTITGTLTAGGTCAVWSGNRFVVGLKNATALSYITSPDGILWTSNAANQFTAPYGIAWSSYQPGSQITNVNVAIQQPTLAFGSGVNTIAYSYDGISWRGIGKDLFTTSGYGGCWNGTIWVAGGISSQSVFTGSISGYTLTVTLISSGSLSVGQYITGTNILPNTFITAGSGLSWTINLPQNVSSTTITANNGVLGYSYDGINWRPVTQTVLTGIIYNVVWNGTLFVAAGGGSTGYCLAYSYDGINNWTAVANTALSLGMGIGYNVVWGQDKFVATGSRIISATFTGTIASSSATLIVTGTVTGTIAIGQIVLGANSQTYISAYGTGTGGAGTYTVSNTQPSAVNIYGTTGGFIGASGGAASFTGTIAITTGVLTVSSVTGTIAIGQMIIGGTVPVGTYITGGSGTTWNTTLSSNPSSYTCTGTTSGGAAYSTDGINWTALKNAFLYNSTEAGTTLYPFGAGIAWGDNRWVYSSGSITGKTFVLYSNTSSITGTFGWVQLNTTSSNFCICYGVYPSGSSTLGTTYSSVFLTSNQGSSSGNYYSTNGGVTWLGPLGSQSYNIVYNGKRFISCNITTGIQYNTIPTSTWTSVTNPTGAQLFTVIRGLATSAWPTLGSTYIDNELTLSSTSGVNTNNQLDVYSDTYFNNGYNNMALTVKALQYPN